MTNTAPETRKFEAEVAQVLHLVTHSLYSHKEIFLRELISNASDACDKLRFESIANPELLTGDGELHIDVSWDPEARTVTVRDNGVGMSRDEVVANIGTIASSGTRRFLEAMSAEQKTDARLIGQFGVGFYSSFVVADRVTVLSRRAGQPAGEGVKWESDGKGEYQLAQVELAERGTAVTLHLKADEDEFLKSWELRSLIRKYSDHVAFPIRMPKEQDGKPGDEWETVNDASALWAKPRNEISDEDYQSFYKSLGHDFNDALAWTHNRVEGSQSFTTLAVHPRAAAVRPHDGRARRAQGTQALYQARLHHGRGRGVAAELPALRAWRGRCGRSAAQCEPRDSPAQPPAGAHSRAPASSACWICWKSWHATSPKSSPPSTRPSATR